MRGWDVTVGADTQITGLGLNEHACLTFCEAEELVDLTAAFVHDGLTDGLKVVWVSDSPQRPAELVERGVEIEGAASTGQMVFTTCESSLLTQQAFRADQAMEWLIGQLEVLRVQDFAGLRVALDMSWALRPVTGIEQLPAFEADLATALAGTPASVLCQYDRDRFDPITLASVATAHTCSVAAATYHHDAVLRICRQYAPPGIRIAGELDRHAADALSMALQETIRLDGDITVNMADLSFIDVASIRTILTAGQSLPAPRTMTLRCIRKVASLFVHLGAIDSPRISLVTVDDR
jgi:anti-anti-sigma regulatory factor